MNKGVLKVIAHADWSASSAKRWMATAVQQPDGRFLCLPPQQVREPHSLLADLKEQVGEHACALAGFDFPIGLPVAYAQQAEIEDFLSILPLLGKGEWANFYEPATSPGEINIRRPFYPAQPGNSRQSHLLDGLGIKTIDDLRRRCELAHPGRRAACPLFWTMGAQQVGKAAISGWREALVGQDGILPYVSLWPFAGRLDELVRPGGVVVAETYPAEFYGHLDVRFTRRGKGRSGKRVQADRMASAPALLAWTERSSVELSPALRSMILDGFGPSPEGEDPFDATVGLMGMINVSLGYKPPGEPDDKVTRKIEGWIFGQEQTAGSDDPAGA